MGKRTEIWSLVVVLFLMCTIFIILLHTQVERRAFLRQSSHKALLNGKLRPENVDGSSTTLLPKTKNSSRVIDVSEIAHLTEAIFPKDATLPVTLTTKYVINNAAVCSRYLSLTYLVVVHSAPKNFLRRQNFRQTWAKTGLFKEHNTGTVFLLGKTLNGETQKAIALENSVNHDIIQGDFVDDFKNLTLKAVMGLRWITENCQHVGFIIKVDDDAFVNIFKVLKDYPDMLKSNPKQLVCSVEPNATIFRNGREKEVEKYIISDEYFSGFSNYPMPFCYGFAVFMPSSLAVKLFTEAKSTPFYRLDDVYVYGILARKINGLTWRNEGEKHYKNESATLKLIVDGRKDDFIVGMAQSAFTVHEMWRRLKDLWT